MIEEINKYIEENRIRKLQLGCGAFPIDGWLNTDLSMKLCKNGIEYLDAGKPFPIISNSFDYIYSEHLIEHLKYSEAKNMVNESYRVLKDGGVLRISTPDLKFLLDLYLNPENELNRSYMESESNRYNIPPFPAFIISHFHIDWGHKIIYDEESLTYILKCAGFKNIKKCEVGKSEHEHLNDIEQHGKHFKNKEYNNLQSMVLEAQK